MQDLTTRAWRRMKSAATSIVFPPLPRALNDYATHLPILIGLSRIRQITTVLEFGCGNYSTTTFLNRSAFPQLERLESIENDASWCENIRRIVKQDRRPAINLVSGEMSTSVTNLDLEAFDLILIDDSTNIEQRVSTIRAIAGRRPQRPWIVIHDYEVEDYRKAAASFKQRHTFRAYNPQTGLLSNTTSAARDELKALEQFLRNMSKVLEPDDVDGWIGAFRIENSLKRVNF